MVKLFKIPAFGFLNKNSVIGKAQVAPSMVLSHNIRKTLGYIPGISLIQGIEHLVRAVQNKKEYSAHFIFRSIVEILGLGFLLLIPDLIVTCVRQQKSYVTPLQARKIVCVPPPTPQTIASAAFPTQVKEFVQPQQLIEPEKPNLAKPKRDPVITQIEQKNLDSTLEQFRLKFKKLIDLNQGSKLEHHLEQSKLNIFDKATLANLKQLILETPFSDMSLDLTRHLYARGALTDSVGDAKFYKALGIKMAEERDPSFFCP